MIQITHLREKDGERYPSTETGDMKRAFSLCFDTELSWGARIECREKEKIVTVVEFMGCKDTTTYEGPEQELAPLLRLVTYYALSKELIMADQSKVKTIAKDILQLTEGRPLFMDVVACLNAGGKFSKVALLGMLLAEHNLEVANLMSMEDLKAIWLMAYVDMEPIEDIRIYCS